MINSTCYNQTWVKLSLWKRLVCGYSFDQIRYFLNQGWFVSSDFFVTECTLFHTPENVLCLPSCWYWPSGSGDFECRQCSFLTIRYYLPLEKDLLFYLKKKLNPPHSMIFFVNQGWNWRMHSVSGEEDKYQTDSQTSRRTDKQAHEKHFLAINILQQSYRYNAGW